MFCLLKPWLILPQGGISSGSCPGMPLRQGSAGGRQKVSSKNNITVGQCVPPYAATVAELASSINDILLQFTLRACSSEGFAHLQTTASVFVHREQILKMLKEELWWQFSMCVQTIFCMCAFQNMQIIFQWPKRKIHGGHTSVNIYRVQSYFPNQKMNFSTTHYLLILIGRTDFSPLP